MSKNPSAVKRVQIALRNNLRNKKYKSSIKTMIKKALEAISTVSENPDNIKRVYIYLSKSHSNIDKAVKHGVIPRNQAARKKSMLSKSLKKIL